MQDSSEKMIRLEGSVSHSTGLISTTRKHIRECEEAKAEDECGLLGACVHSSAAPSCVPILAVTANTFDRQRLALRRTGKLTMDMTDRRLGWPFMVNAFVGLARALADSRRRSAHERTSEEHS